jgi:hypothetical protein
MGIVVSPNKSVDGPRAAMFFWGLQLVFASHAVDYTPWQTSEQTAQL